MLVMAAPNIIQYPSQGPIVSPIEREVVGGHISGRERRGLVVVMREWVRVCQGPIVSPIEREVID